VTQKYFRSAILFLSDGQLADRTPVKENATCVKAGYNTSTVALRVLRADKREPNAQGYNWATLFLGDINMGLGPPSSGSLRQ
jgi:hypothetical protein